MGFGFEQTSFLRHGYVRLYWRASDDCDGRPRPKLTSISLTVCVRMRTWISLPRPPLPLLPLPLPSLSVALPLCAAVVAVEERDGGGGEWRFGSPFRAGAATADAAYSIIPIVAAATAA